MIGGAIGAAEYRSLLEAQSARNEIAILRVRIAQFGKRPQSMPAHHPVPDTEPSDIGADRDDLAGRFATRDKGRFRSELVFPGEHQDVDILRAARPDPDLYLAGARWGRVRDLA